jgi:hypothetical protein
MDIGAIVGWIMANIGTVVTGILAVLGGFSILAKLTPTTKDDAAIDWLLTIIHTLGLTKTTAGK